MKIVAGIYSEGSDQFAVKRIVPIVDALKVFFDDRVYGKEISEIHVGINLVEDTNTPITGTDVLRQGKAIKCPLVLNSRDLESRDFAECYTLVIKKLSERMKEVSGIPSLSDFKLNSLQDDLLWLGAHVPDNISKLAKAKESTSITGKENASRQPISIAENGFWDLIYHSKQLHPSNLSNQAQMILQTLKGMRSEDIIGFEMRLRQLLLAANHYNILAAQKIVEGDVSDDSFLYYRCALIMLGKEIFYACMDNPDDFTKELYSIEGGAEELLELADRAMKEKYGSDIQDVGLPREICSEFIDYDFGVNKMLGEDWKEADLPRRFPKLWAMRRTDRVG
ncbi:MAG: DUF4240 domain-containing protein [Candidatus Omnitrophica bacterium]|nr:DUF4240 domain-containing protein [Candidatus Omnitrophota bacterium]